MVLVQIPNQVTLFHSNADLANNEDPLPDCQRSRRADGQRIMIDTSHANSGKKPENQPLVAADIAGQIAAGEQRIVGVMIESNLVAGRQDVVPGAALTYGRSITDGCIDWDSTEEVLSQLSEAVAARRTLRVRARQGRSA